MAYIKRSTKKVICGYYYYYIFLVILVIRVRYTILKSWVCLAGTQILFFWLLEKVNNEVEKFEKFFRTSKINK